MPMIPVKRAPLKLPQVRVLKVLEGGAALDKREICARAGFSPTSGTSTQALNGVREGSSHGSAYPGLVETGLVDKLELDVDGLAEQVYRITPAGKDALKGVERLPDLRDKDASTNKRYGGSHRGVGLEGSQGQVLGEV